MIVFLDDCWGNLSQRSNERSKAMKTNFRYLKTQAIPSGWWRTALLVVALVAVMVAVGSAKTAKEIDVSVDIALERFYKQVDGAREFAKSAKGILVMPNVKKGAFIVGGEYGEGALRVGGKTVGYYNTVSGSIGLQIGGEAKDIILCFMTAEALKNFGASKGWEAGVDGNVALITVGAGGRADTTTVKEPIVGFVFDVKGLMADVSLKGAKFSKIEK
jgi:lipid-binding SYLF domain-containing protein